MEVYECWRCGKQIALEHEPIERLFCEECKQAHEEEHRAMIAEYAALKIRVMHENAIRIMEKAETYMHEYKESSEKVLESAMQDTERFYSADEMVAAIILTEFGYEFAANYKIDKYRVDFFIPELCVCLEVDGHLHRGKEVFDNNRDIDIRNALGAEWEVIRIPTQYIEKAPVLIPEAIERLAKEKRKIRKENNGFLPETFSRRQRKHYETVGETYNRRVRK